MNKNSIPVTKDLQKLVLDVDVARNRIGCRLAISEHDPTEGQRNNDDDNFEKNGYNDLKVCCKALESVWYNFALKIQSYP